MNELKRAALATLLLGFSICASAQDSLVDPVRYRGLASDHRAAQVGDLVTVLVLEASRARSQAATDANSGLSMGANVHTPSTDYDASLGLQGANTGAAQTTRIGELRAQISAQVTAVEPNGLLRIDGTQALTINGEQQTIRLRGLVRPEDIDAGNAVLSTRIAQAEIELVGAGVVSESQRQSVIYRLFKWLRLL